MEVGSGSSSNSSSSSSSGPFNRLKFGKKNYLKDTGRSAAGLTKKWKKDVVVQGGQPPLRCQVEGCEVNLRSGKAYYSRHRVCGIHSKSAKVIVDGAEQRFCQQCSRFHMVSEFDKGKRSCRRRLACHNERRRKQLPDETLFGSYGTESSSKAGGSFMLDFSAHSKPNSTASSGEIFSPHPWRPEISEILFQGGSTDTRANSRECLTGVSDCSRALSLLSTQTWDSRNGIINAIETTSPMVVQLLQSSGTGRTAHTHSEEESIHGLWKSFKAIESNTNNNSTSQQQSTEVGQIQSSQPVGNYYYGDLDELGQQNESGYVGLFEQQLVEYDSFDSSMPHHSKAYDSFLQNMLI